MANGPYDDDQQIKDDSDGETNVQTNQKSRQKDGNPHTLKLCIIEQCKFHFRQRSKQEAEERND